MTHEKIIKDQRGTIRIEVKLWSDQWGGTDLSGNTFRYDIKVSYIPPRKRTEIWDGDIATAQEIFDAKMEFWNLIKPKP
mgnify:FL=1